MADSKRTSSAFQFSLRELLALVVVAAVGIAALKLGDVVAAGFLLALLVLCMALAVVALVDRGARQAFALGFVLCVAIYAAVILFSDRKEFDPYQGSLPTTRLLKPAFQSIAKATWIDMNTGKEITDYDPSSNQVAKGRGLIASSRMFVSANETPDRRTFMSVGHSLWALLLGYFGGKFATFVFHRRQANE